MQHSDTTHSDITHSDAPQGHLPHGSQRDPWLEFDGEESLHEPDLLQQQLTALADPVRRYLIELLEVDHAYAGDLAASAADRWGISISRASQHLQVLARADLVAVSVDGTWRSYCRRTGAAQELADWLARVELSTSRGAPAGRDRT